MLGLNHNAIRQHLAKLVDADLVTHSTAPVQGRGRPCQIFEVHPVIDDRWGAGGPYRRLSMLLVQMIRSGDTAVEVGRKAGREREPSQERDPVSGLERAATTGGFDPVLVERGGQTELVLRNCPFADAASADPETICSLHLGLAQGVAERFDNLVVDGLEAHDPMEAGCRLRFHVVEADADLSILNTGSGR